MKLESLNIDSQATARVLSALTGPDGLAWPPLGPPPILPMGQSTIPAPALAMQQQCGSPALHSLGHPRAVLIRGASVEHGPVLQDLPHHDKPPGQPGCLVDPAALQSFPCFPACAIAHINYFQHHRTRWLKGKMIPVVSSAQSRVTWAASPFHKIHFQVSSKHRSVLGKIWLPQWGKEAGTLWEGSTQSRMPLEFSFLLLGL